MRGMSSAAFASSAGLFHEEPVDLDRIQRSLLVGAVVVAHIAMGLVVMTAVKPPVAEEPLPPIEVSLISPEQAMEPMAPPVVKPAPPEPRQAQQPVAAPRVPVQRTPPVVASTAPAQATDMQVPPAPAETPPTPVPPAVAQPAVAPAVAATMNTAAEAKAPAGPKELPSTAVRYLVSPPVVYPRVSKELGESGVVKLRVLIDEQGRLKNIVVSQSSGYPRLDQQAVAALRQARFQPFIDNGVPREVATTASIVFSLEEQ
jgi:protein TonB